MIRKDQKIEGYRQRNREWDCLGSFWASLSACHTTYPLKKNGQERYEGEVYQIVVRKDARIFEISKVIWKEKEFFLLTSPGFFQEGHLSFKVFSWTA